MVNNTIAKGVYNLEVDQTSQFEVNILQKGYSTIYPSLQTQDTEILNIYHFSLGKLIVHDYYIVICKTDFTLYSLDKTKALSKI